MTTYSVLITILAIIAILSLIHAIIMIMMLRADIHNLEAELAECREDGRRGGSPTTNSAAHWQEENE